MAKKYSRLESDEPVNFDWKDSHMFMACCDCGLVHKIKVEVDGNNVTLMFNREDRRTGQIRRHRKIRIVEESK